ncbi:hypothetical protein ATK17_3515 [Branchiibius hedensis]|uniref:Amidohydrolase 3 domain-containing protein n=1 Tax=Branchiibius hedensis TaxID=672460 RepID=A0A2Y8ZW18_9MICO|nr:amidohydrolase [Branchiibius hedensis]PWJ27324.1 hypothetical protein ATK17_3515 [Branchiibius hedensis]SSA36135.1 hypothetical protein SAMN04489750_3515 [Branchiibius hedensis]
MTAADLVLTGPIWTGDPAGSWADALAIRDGRVVAMGSAACTEVAGRRTDTFTVADGLVVPGFQDAHVHPPFAGRNLDNVDLSAATGLPAYLQLIRTYAESHPERDWIVGGGWALESFPGGQPRKEDLDAVVPDRPVFLFNKDVHGAWVNSEALRRAGIDAATPDPADGRYERDPATGQPTGMLQEGAAYTFESDVVPAPTTKDWAGHILAAQHHLHSLGITGWQDAWVTPATQRAYEYLAGAEQLTARVVGALWWDRHQGVEQIDSLVERRRDVGNFHATSVKIMVDGIVENGTAAMLEPYCRHDLGEHPNGLTYVESQALADVVTRLDGLGFQVHQHAIGDAAVRSALDAVEAARKANGSNDLRHHIAHLQVVNPQDLPRFRALDVVVNMQTYWAQNEPQMRELNFPVLGQERSAQMYPFATIAASGAVLAMGSDWGVTTADPLQQIEVAVHRVDPATREEEPFLPHEGLPMRTALSAFTAGSAYVNHDAEGGYLAVGQRADLAVLDTNIFDAGVRPADATVTHTMAAGRWVFGG